MIGTIYKDEVVIEDEMRLFVELEAYTVRRRLETMVRAAIGRRMLRDLGIVIETHLQGM